LAALVIESGPAGHDPLADIDRRVGDAIEALPGVVAAVAWLRRPPLQRTVYVALESGAGVYAVRKATRRILRRSGVCVRSSCVHIAPIDASAA